MNDNGMISTERGNNAIENKFNQNLQNNLVKIDPLSLRTDESALDNYIIYDQIGNGKFSIIHYSFIIYLFYL